MARPSAVAAVLAVFIVAMSAGVGSQSELVITRAGDKEYHWPGCERIRDGKDVLALTRAQATARGLKPHAACDPSTSPRPGDSSKSSPAPDPVVYVDNDGRYYHKKDCAKLGKTPRKLSLDEAGRKNWPCPTCKPPIRKRKG